MDVLNKTLAQMRREQMKAKGITPRKIQQTKSVYEKEANGPSLAYRVAVNRVLKDLDQELKSLDEEIYEKRAIQKNLEFGEIEEKWEKVDWLEKGILIYAWSELLKFSDRKYQKEVYKLVSLDKEMNALLKQRIFEDWATQQQSILHRYTRDRIQLSKEISIADGQKQIPYKEHQKGFKKQLLTSKKRLNWVLDDEIHRLDGDLDRRRQMAAGIDSYTWITKADGRVRPSHAARHGGVYFWDDPPPGGHPKTEGGCRCWAAPNVERTLALAILPILLKKKEKEQEE